MNRSLRVTDFTSLKVGDQATLRKVVTAADIDAFARLSGDFNPLHVDEEFATHTRFGRRVAHGMLSAAYVSALIGMRLPGPGALWLRQSLDFVTPVFASDTIEFRLWIEHKSDATRCVVVRLEARNQHDAVVVRGRGTVMALAEPSPSVRAT